MHITRRDMLKVGAAVSVGAVVAPSLFRRAHAAAAVDPPSDPTRYAGRTLIVVQMAGGNDGINTVIPYASGAYYSARQNIAIPQAQVLTLNNAVGLHPSMTALKSVWDAGKLAVVQGVSYPNPSSSHFEAMDIWRSADPKGVVRDGWLGRYLEKLESSQRKAFAGLALGNQLPGELLSYEYPVPTVESIQSYQFLSRVQGSDLARRRTQALMDMYKAFPSETPFAGLFDATLNAAADSSEALQRSNAGYVPAVTYPQNNSLSSGLKLLARAIDARLGLKVGHVSIGSYDTHANQTADQSRLLQGLSDALGAFYEDLKAHGKDQDVVVMTWSEFGRRVQSNGSGGTDHGSATVQFVMGGPVRGGLYGEYPSLTNLDNGNLKFTTDFRSVYATLLEEWLGVNADLVLGGRYPRLGFLQSVSSPAA